MHFISKYLPSNQKMYRDQEIENYISDTSKIDLIMPIEENIQSIINYKDDIIVLVDDHTREFTEKKSPEEFYRPSNKPVTEEFFTSAENREIVERAFLKKGIEILNAATTTNKNIRALGYSIPSHKNFGFGALCFTWRNVPNNAPLVFWYLGGGFTPLFKVQRGITNILDLNALLFG